MIDELKRCPFCGGEARAFRCEESGTFDVQCQQCGAIPFIGSRTSEKKTMADVIAAWNARAAVTDEQFAIAVHDGEAWQRVRTCRPTPSIMNDVEHIVVQRVGSSEFQLKWPYQRCSECSADFPEGSRYCPGCGAKVVAE